MPSGLLTDLYELNMAGVHLRRSVAGQATFSLFVRALPSDRGFLVTAGLADCLQFLEDFSFTGDDLSNLRRTRGYREETLRALAGLRFTGDVLALRDESTPPGHEPLLVPVMRGKRRLDDPEPLAAAQGRCRGDLAWLPPAARALRRPEPVPVRVSEQLKALQEQVTRDLRRACSM